jgi:hypothetical protein
MNLLRMRANPLIAIAVCFALGIAVAQQDEGGIPHEPKTMITMPSPDGRLVAISRSPIPDTTVPDYEDADGTLIFIRGPNRGDRIIAHRFFAGRFISKMLWSPDSQFLVLCSESAGGHSPWHFNSYFWSRDDRKFRSIDFRAGPVVSDEFAFTAPHNLTLKIAPTAPDKTFDLDHPVEKIVNLSEIRRTTPPLQPGPRP